MNLDALLVTPRAPWPQRAAIEVSCLEHVIDRVYTVDNHRLYTCGRRASGLRFVWIMGADNLAQFIAGQNCGASHPSARSR